MKITVIKKSTGKVNAEAACPWFLEVPPMSKS